MNWKTPTLVSDSSGAVYCAPQTATHLLNVCYYTFVRYVLCAITILLEHVFRKLGDIHFAWCPIHCWCLILQFLSQQFPSTQLPNVCFYNYPCWDISRLTCVTKTERPWTWRHAQLTHLQFCWTTEGRDLFLSKFIACKAWRSILWYTVSLLNPQMLIKWICLLQFQLQNFEVLSFDLSRTLL